jgi:hypothetical protein
VTDAEGQPDAVTTALVAELGKKTGVCWLRYDGREHAAWHVWFDDGTAPAGLAVVSGGPEQPLPGLDEVETVEVVMRSKESGGRLLVWVGAVEPVAPGDPLWGPVTEALAGQRLNLPDLATAADIWAEQSRVVRVVPTGEVREHPDDLDDRSLAAPPQPTGATTRGALPRVLHRRVRRRPRLS